MSSRLPDQLPAKSIGPSGRLITLESHLCDTERAAQILLGAEHRWGRSFRRFFKLQESQHERLVQHVRLAALFHDLGKANEDFVAAASRRSRDRQTLRHEHLSALLLHLPELRQWLGANPQLDLEVITAAVLSHHFKAAREEGEWQWGAPRGLKTELALFLEHREVKAVLGRVAEVAGVPVKDLPVLPSGPWKGEPPWTIAYDEGYQAARRLDRDRRSGSNPERQSLLRATKVALIAADAASSGLVREGRALDSWLTEVVRGPPLTAEELEEKVLRRRIAQIQKKQQVTFAYQPFQNLAAGQGPRVLLLAACGTGKTLAAYRWAQEQLRSHPAGKVIFLYPTRGTATEGFRDYLAWAPEADATLLHATSRYELDAMESNPEEPTFGKKFLKEEDERLFALAHWPKRLFSATVDQLLGFMEHSFRSTCLVPALADSVLIIDEIHSFDRHLFDVLVSFLQTFDLPVLCMTATLPPGRRKQLEDLGLKVFPEAADRAELPDLEQEEGRSRYLIESVRGEEEALTRALAAYREGKGQRVLWVVNQVGRCQRLARQVEQALGRRPFCYHSRFRLEDRQERHQEVVAAFQQADHPEFAVTTQVCEMSLDLDADVLVTEEAPVTSLVQRFGRANRQKGRPREFRARILTYPPERPEPYERHELEAARNFLRELGTSEVSQRRLAEALEKHACGEPRADCSASFLEGGYFAIPGTLRDGEERTRPCLLDKDLDCARQLYEAHKTLDGLIVGVPFKHVLPDAARPAWLPRYLGVASAQKYREDLGFVTNEEILP